MWFSKASRRDCNFYLKVPRWKEKQTKMGRETEEHEFTKAVPSVFKGLQVRSFLMLAILKEIIIFSLVISWALESKLYYLHSCNVFTILGCIFFICLMLFQYFYLLWQDLVQTKIITVLTFFSYPPKVVQFITAETASLPSPSLIPTVLIMRKKKKNSLWKTLCIMTL